MMLMQHLGIQCARGVIVGHFLSDLERSRTAVNVLMDRYKSLGFDVKELLTKEEQKYGDFSITQEGRALNIEVKFDEMAAKTGNLCFEMSNGSRMTGVMETMADIVIYAVPYKHGFHIYMFRTQELREFITNPENVIVKNGGDKKKFVLALAKITAVVELGLPDEIFDLVC